MSVQHARTIITTMLPLGLKELRLSGGEPTLNHLTFLDIIDYAYERKILVKLDTNGAWASPFRHYTSFEIASKVCNSLMRRGVYSICLSADYEHLKFIDGQIIEDIIAVCFDLGLSIGVVACDFHNRQPNFVDVWFSKFYEKYIAPAYPSPATVVHSVCEHPLYQYPEWFPTSPTDYGWQPRMYWANRPIVPFGNVSERDIYHQKKWSYAQWRNEPPIDYEYENTCMTHWNFDPDGTVRACMFRAGNMFKENLLDIIGRSQESYVHKILNSSGPFDLASEVDKKYKTSFCTGSGSYTSPCDLCNKVLKFIKLDGSRRHA